MGILDWFINRPAQFDPDAAADAIIDLAVDKAVTLVNPRLKLIPAYQESLRPAAEKTVRFLRSIVNTLPATLEVSAATWAGSVQLRAFFAAAADIPVLLGRSRDLRKLFDKCQELDTACFVLGMEFSEARVDGMALQGDLLLRGVAQTTISFSQHQARICGQGESEVLRLLGTQMYEYLVAQALASIAEDRAERRELADHRALLQARLRLLRQQGPGLGSLFGEAPASSLGAAQLEAELVDNERRIEAAGNGRSALDGELEILCGVLEQPERYIRIEPRRMRLSPLNVVIEEEKSGEKPDANASAEAADRVSFSVAHLTGAPALRKAFLLGRIARCELPPARIDFAEAQRAL